jgi:hypothetical protein
MEQFILLLVLLQTKHLLVDWLWQPPYEYLNKGTYAHWGGIRHSLKNALGTTLCFLPWATAPQLLIILALDFFIHYHIDWGKMNINRIMKWGPTTHEQFWWLTGLDQFAHQICYIGCIALVLLW